MKLFVISEFSVVLFLQDWIDIDFGVAEGVDFIAISFVRTAEVIKHLKSYINARSPHRCESLTLLSPLVTVHAGLPPHCHLPCLDCCLRLFSWLSADLL